MFEVAVARLTETVLNFGVDKYHVVLSWEKTRYTCKMRTLQIIVIIL